MSRERRREALQIQSGDDWLTRIGKHIPGPIIGTYLAINAALNTNALQNKNVTVWLWITFVLLLAATPLWLIFIENVRMIRQNIIAPISFTLWVMAIGGPFAKIKGYETYIASILLILCTGVVFPLITKIFD